MEESITIINNNTLRIVEDTFCIEIPIKIIHNSEISSCSGNCSFGRLGRCINTEDNLFPCAQLSIILEEELGKSKDIAFDIDAEDLDSAKEVFLTLINNRPGLIKKRRIFRRQQK